MLGAADLVVSSRFHALLGALSSGVPAVAVGWSHKYEELFSDFGATDLAVQHGDDATEVVDRILARTGGDAGESFRASLREISARQRTALTDVFDDVAALIR